MRKLKSIFSDVFFNFYKDKKIKDFIFTMWAFLSCVMF